MSISIVSGSIMIDNYGSIRTTEDGRISVYDLIAVCSEGKSKMYPVKTWEKLMERTNYPELANGVVRHQFPGARQRPTPICNKETALEILGLLPGAAGRKYRAIAAKLVLAYLENPESLADLAVERMDQLGDVAALERHKVRVDGKIKRLQFTDELQSRGIKGCDYGKITNAMTKETLGLTATEIKVARNVKNAREAMSEFELAAIGASESLAKALMIKRQSNGFVDCNTTCVAASTQVKQLLDS